MSITLFDKCAGSLTSLANHVALKMQEKGPVSMFDGSLMLRVNSPVVDTIHPKSNTFVMGVRIKATSELKLNKG